MKKNLRSLITPLNGIYAVFIAAEIAIFIAFNVIVSRPVDDPVYLKYSGILLCFAFAAVMIYFYRKDAIILTCALLFTAISDYFILVIDTYYEIGVTTFFVAQAIHFYRLYANRINNYITVKKLKIRVIYISLAVRAVIIATIISVFAAVASLNYLLIICTIYFTMLVGNCVDAFIICRGGWKNLLYAVGLLLFVGCDVCVALHNASVLDLQLPSALLTFVQYAIWVFYLPAQVCIVSSAVKGGLMTEKQRVQAVATDSQAGTEQSEGVDREYAQIEGESTVIEVEDDEGEEEF